MVLSMNDATYSDEDWRNGPRGGGGADGPEALPAVLENTRGYRVSTPDGRVLGRLAWMKYRPRDGRIEELMIQPPGWQALFSTRERGIPSELVEAVSHVERRIVVSAWLGPAPAADQAPIDRWPQ